MTMNGLMLFYQVNLNMISVNGYFLASEGNRQLTKNFKVNEFKSRNCQVTFIQTELVDILQKLRTKLNTPVNVNSGFRTYTHNKAVNGSTNSAHLLGCAADISTSKYSAEQLAKELYNMFGNKIAIGLHTKENYVHIDTIYRGNFYKETLSNKVSKF